MAEINPYWAIAINSFITGFTVIAAQEIFKLYFSHRLKRMKKHQQKISNGIKKTFKWW
jgi:hypothetical protein